MAHPNFASDAPDYLRLLKGGSAYRMTRLKDRSAQSMKKSPSQQKPTWREAREWGFHNWAAAHGTLSQGFNTENYGTPYAKKMPVWYCHTGEQFRNERYADQVEGAYIKHTGWYSNTDCSETYRGIVACLTHGRFIAGYYCSMNGERVYFAKVFDDECEAAQFADSEAERNAEAEKEYNERWHEAQELAELIAEQSRDVARMFKLRHTDGFDSAADYRELEEAIRVLRQRKENLRDNYSDIE